MRPKLAPNARLGVVLGLAVKHDAHLQERGRRSGARRGGRRPFQDRDGASDRVWDTPSRCNAQSRETLREGGRDFIADRLSKESPWIKEMRVKSEAANNVVPMQIHAPNRPALGGRRGGDTARSAVSLFAGAGGLDIGAERSGFLTRTAVEIDPVAQETLLSNRGYFPALEADTIFSDIVTLDFHELLHASRLEQGEVDLVHGGPPCTPFSKSGYWLAYKRAGEDPKASLLDSYVAALKAVRPKAFLMENVYGLAYNNQNRPILDRFIASVREAGYSLDWRILVAADFGVPQLRQRLICLGVRADLLDVPADMWRFDWPRATHDGPHERRVDRRSDLPAHVTAGEALADLLPRANPAEPEEVVRGTYARELRKVPPGDNYLYFTSKRGHRRPRFEWRSRYWSFLLKLHPDRPSPTVQGQPGPWVGPFHWEGRRLRVAEVKRLMTFPDDFAIQGNRRSQQLQLGNAVPPLLAETLISQIAVELDRLEAPVAVSA
jgi:DNA (cytosine-5)-methyltransferase 1